MSEERPYPNLLNKDGQFIVTFDAIDGNRIIEANYTVGSIFGIWPNKDINGMCGQDMLGAALAVYSSRTAVVVYNSIQKRVQEYTLREKEDDTLYWVLTKENIRIKNQTRVFSPANSKAILDNNAYRKAIDFWTKTGYILRYSGATTADIYHIFMESEGVYLSIGSKL